MESNPREILFHQIEQGSLPFIEDTVLDLLDSDMPAEEIVSVMVSALRLVGERYQQKEIFLNEMLLSAMTMQRGVNMLRPYIVTDSRPVIGTAILGTVEGDIHDVGKNLVAMMMEAAGIRVIDLGVNVPPARFAEAIREHPECRIVGLSALLTTTLSSLTKTLKAIEAAGLRDQVYVMVGGGSVTESFAKRVGADAYTADAAAAMKQASRFLTETAE